MHLPTAFLFITLKALLSALPSQSFSVNHAQIHSNSRELHRYQWVLPSTSTDKEATFDNKIDENPRLNGLAFQLDNGTRKSHSIAQNTQFVSGFFKGLSTRESYANLLRSYYFIYKAMEDAFDSTTNELVQRMDSSELRRMEALRLDMEYFHGSDWEKTIVPSPATNKYVSRIQEIAKEEPNLLIAHQYTRYLGDLFGGQMMSGMATKSLSLEEGNGVSFYEFEEISSVGEYITEWYGRLNQLNLSDEMKEAIVDEANLVFDFNIEIFGELEGSAWKAVWSLAWESIREKFASFSQD